MWQTTCWDAVVKAQENNKDALQELCRDYWQPVYTYLRQKKFSEEEAQDLTQSFFLQFLEKSWIKRADQTKGKFRTFLLVLLKRFVRDLEQKAQKRFEKSFLHIDTLTPFPQRFLRENKSAEDVFHHAWAQSLLEVVLDVFRRQSIKESKQLEYMVVWRYFFYGTSLIQVGDVLNPEKWANFILYAKDDLAVKLRSTFTAEETAACQQIHQQKNLSISFQRLLCQKMNEAMRQDFWFSLEKSNKLLYLYPCDILDIHLCWMSLEQSPFSSYVSSQTQKLIDQNTNSAKVALCQDLNRFITEDPYQRRLQVEKCSRGSIETSTLRWNRLHLEQLYPQEIIPSFYSCYRQPSYEQIASSFATTRHKVEYALTKGIEKYYKILKDEIARYCEESEVETEIQSLTEILAC